MEGSVPEVDSAQLLAWGHEGTDNSGEDGVVDIVRVRKCSMKRLRQWTNGIRQCLVPGGEEKSKIRKTVTC